MARPESPGDRPTSSASRTSQLPALPVRVGELRRQVGNQVHHDLEVELGGGEVGGTRIGDGPARVSADLETVSGGVVLDGIAQATWQGECRRCLEPIDGPLVVELHELFCEDPAVVASNPASGSDPDVDPLPIVDDTVDLGPPVRESLLLALPLAPLCRPDCPGPDPVRYPVEVADDAAPDAIRDPRWAALDQLRDLGGPVEHP